MTKTARLLKSIRDRDLAAVDALLAAGAPINGNPRYLRWFREPTPLQAAIFNGNRRYLQHLQWVGELTPSQAANFPDYKEIVVYLLDHGADPNLDTDAWDPPLALACCEDDLELIDLLLQRGACLNPPLSSRHLTPIEVAARHRQVGVIDFLLERGADPNVALDENRNTLFRYSASVLERLIAAGGQAPPDVERAVREGRW